ncbi:MAG: O-methyltransferase [Bacteroidota bacterium]
MVNQEKIEKAYCADHTSSLPPELEAIERQAFLTTTNPGLLTGPYTGRFLMMVSQMLKPESVLEIGTFTGYSAICLATGLQEGGQLITIEVNLEREKVIRQNLEATGQAGNVKLVIGDALEILPDMNKTFDLIFIDGNKLENQKYFDAVFPNLRIGGFLLVDNVLWYGKVAANASDKDSVSIRTFNKNIQKDQRLENILLPIGDGLLLLRKLKD